jgi:glycosyltransferase involved in cell wall biosynthesis/SAM-dependent methyltransferase
VRLGIDYRLLASRENLVNRGIGRYTQQQLRHVLALDADNEYLLLCPPRSDVSLVLPEIRGAANVSLYVEPPPEDRFRPADPYDRRGLLSRAAAYQDWVGGLDLDVYHSTAPFVLEQTAPTAFDVGPTVATVYDLIPLVFPGSYLADPRHRAAYAAAARLVTTATRLLAISDGTRDDVVEYLGFPRDAVDRAWPFADACFRPMGDDAVTAALGPLHARVGLPDRFVLTVSALHHTKNLELLLAAYARLSAPFRRALPLVVACHLEEAGVAHVRRLADRFGVAGEVVLTGYVTDGELAALYNRATLVVHPSRYEGFGLPVVEAMQCGAAVVTTTAPSLPEVTAGAAVLVDPDDPIGLAAAIDGLMLDPQRREELGALGLVRAGAFTPEALAHDTLASYRAARADGCLDGGGPRVAVCSPFPPSGAAAPVGGFDLLDALPDGWDVDVFTDDSDGPLPDELLDRFPVHHCCALGKRRHSGFDAVISNVEAAAAHDPTGAVDGPTVTVVRSEVEGARLHRLDPKATVVVAPPSGAETAAAGLSGSLRDALVAATGLSPDGPVRRRRPPEDLGFNKLCDVEDFDLPALRAALRQLGYGESGAGTRGWAMAMSLRAADRFGVLDRERRILSLGHAGSALGFRLTRTVGEVTMAGPWLEAGASPASRAMLVDPGLVAPVAFDRRRLVVHHADLRALPFPDAAFDAVFSCRAVDGFRAGDVAVALCEAARVVRPGGLVTFSVRVRLRGPEASPAIPLARGLWDAVAATGLSPVDPVVAEVSGATMTGRRHLSGAFGGTRPDGEERPLAVDCGALVGCLHLALRRPGGQSGG